MDTHVLLITCTDAKGLISQISTSIFQLSLNIVLMREFVEPETNTFFMRCEISGQVDLAALRSALENCLPEDANIRLHAKVKKDLVILVTKEFHCLSDLLTKHFFGEINANILAVVSNHNYLQPFVDKFSIPFHFVSHEGRTKEDFEAEILKTCRLYSPDYLVLAKFMRILSADFVAGFENRIVNIHHSFLPAFVGANPYRQAYERGVKLIGATAHFVTNQLDEGPIICQEVVQTDHNFTVKKMVQAGHEVERAVLLEALQLIVDDKVFVSGNKTILFG